MTYGCDKCGYRSAQWLGFCPSCRDEGGLRETSGTVGAEPPKPLGEIEVDSAGFVPTGLEEWDRVVGGGLVPGSTILLAGEPGVGKSTLSLQVAAALARQQRAVLVATSEESVAQVGLRGRRLRAVEPGVHVLGEQNISAVVAASRHLAPSLLVVDSIQTASATSVTGGAGGAAQVRQCTTELIDLARATGLTVILVGHVTKDGAIAGPKTLEHLVDVVLALDGDHHRSLRMLRCRKNRYGPTNRMGLFELEGDGFRELPEAGLVDSWRGDVPGTVVFPAVEGARSVLVEIQALTSKASGPQPRRSVRGVDSARVHQLLAVLERHAGLSFAGMDAYVAVGGGMRVTEPGADLPTAMALASSLAGRPVGSIAAWGEVGLTGELRSVGGETWRREEVKRLGIRHSYEPGSPCDRIGPLMAAMGLALAREVAGAA